MPAGKGRRVTVLAQERGGLRLVEALFYPEFAFLGGRREALESKAADAARKVLEHAPLDEVWRRARSGTPRKAEFHLLWTPPWTTAAFDGPVRLRFDALYWEQAGKWIAYLPALGVEAVGSDEDELEQAAREELEFFLRRAGAGTSLRRLWDLQAAQSLEVSEREIFPDLLTPKQMAQRQPRGGKSALDELAIELKREELSPAYELEPLLKRLADLLSGESPRSVLLVGPSGAGKTALVRELARRRERFGLGGVPFYAASGTRLIASARGFGMLEDAVRRLAQDAAARKAIVHLGGLFELMEVGKHEGNPAGIAHLLAPALARGDFCALAECTAEQAALIEREDQHLLDAFERLVVAEPDEDRAKAILLGRAAELGHGKPALELAELEAVDRLHRRYASYSAFPGRPLRFLDNLVRDHERSGEPITSPAVTRAFARETGLPLFLLDDAEPLDLAAAHAYFAGRVLGQPAAVELIVDLLAVLKAGLSRPGKPLASLLFIGPTGVGKTELAKALAEYLFGSPERLVRLDMSEYAGPAAVARLTGGVFGREGVLTAKAREQPFSVLLLDEFEKADPSFFDLLLQVLGEGRLTDASGNLADFRNAVVIMTSNLGAESFGKERSGFATGEASGAARAAAHFEAAVREFLRPELFNRLDRIVPFAPLERATVARIAERELERAARLSASARGLALEAAPGTAERLAELGFEPRYGARPLRRAAERDLLLPLAEGLCAYSGELRLAARVAPAGKGLSVEVRARKESAADRAARAGLCGAAEGWTALRRRARALERGAAVLGLRNEAARLKRQLSGKKAKAHGREQREARLRELERSEAALMALLESAEAGEERALLALHGRLAAEQSPPPAELEAAQGRWRELLLALFALGLGGERWVTVAVIGPDKERLAELAEHYALLADGWGLKRMPSSWLEPSVRMGSGFMSVSRNAKDERRPWADPSDNAVALAMSFTGPSAYARLRDEPGLHEFRSAKMTSKLVVQVIAEGLGHYQLPEGAERKAYAANQKPRRVYDLDRGVFEDKLLKRTFRWKGDGLREELGRAMEALFARNLERELDIA